MTCHACLPSWDKMLPELLGRCFNVLDDQERCRVVPLVSHAFRDSHLSYPPQPTQLTIAKPLSDSRVQWFLRTSQRVEQLVVKVSESGSLWLFPLLQSGNVLNLRRLELWLIWEGTWLDDGWDPRGYIHINPLLICLSSLHLCELSLLCWDINEDRSISGFQALSSLDSLVNLELGWYGFSNITEQQADSLWKALASLKSLAILKLRPLQFDHVLDYFGTGDAIINVERPFFYQGLSALTQIRELLVFDCDHCVLDQPQFGQRPTQHGSFALLTQLRSLKMTEYLLGPISMCFRPLLALTQLEEMWLDASDFSHHCSDFYDYEEYGPSLDLSPFIYLTSLRLTDWTYYQIDEYIPASMPALATLRHLALRGFELNNFSPTLAGALVNLTSLDLHWNSFVRLPVGMTKLAALILLDISENVDLQLMTKDVDTLQAMPAFQGLNVDDCPRVCLELPEASLAIVQEMQTSFKGMPSMPSY